MAQNLITKHIIEAVVKPTLDKSEREKLNSDLSKIFTDAANIDFNTKETRDNLNNLAKAFKAIFDKIGDTSIDFEQMIKMPPPEMFAKLGEVAAKQFWSAWDSVAKSQSPVDFSAELEQLKESRKQLFEEQKKIQQELNKKVPNKERAKRLLDFDGDNVDPLQIDGDAIEEAKRMYVEIQKVGRELQKIKQESGADSKEYIKAVYDAEEQYKELYRMRAALRKLETPVPKGIKAAYGLLGEDEQAQYEMKAYDAGKKPVVPFHDLRSAEIIEDAAASLTKTAITSQRRLDEIGSQIAEIDVQIESISQQMQALGRAEDPIAKGAKDGLKTLNEVEEAYKRILTTGKKRAARPDQKKLEGIEKSLAFDPEQSKKGIKSLYDEYLNASESGNWEDAYQALLKYVRLYESYQKSENQTHRNKVSKPGNEFTSLYEQLKPMAANAENALRNVVNMAKDMPLTDMSGVEEKKDVETEPNITQESISNAQQLKEEKENQLRVEKEKEDSLHRQIAAEEKIADAQEASTEARKEELGLMQAMEKFQVAFEKTDGKNETLAFVNTNTGDMSDLVVGDKHGVTMKAGTSRKMSGLGYDMEVHSHSWKTATPSVDDFEEWFKQLEYIKKFGIRAGEELLAFDFSNLDPSKLLEVIDKYEDLDEQISSQVKSMSLDEKLDKFGSYQGIQEAVQVMLRQGLEEIMQDIPGVMQSIKMPALPVSNIYSTPQQKNKDANTKSLSDVYANANEEVQELIKNYAILAQKSRELTDDEYDRFIEIGDKLEKVAPDAFLAPASQWQGFDANVTTVEQAVDSLNESLEKTKQLTSGDGAGSGTGDASLTELEAERAKAESLQNELDNRIGALQAAHDEKEMLQSDLNVANEQIKIAQDSEMAARARADETDLRLIEKDKQIQDLEERLAQSQAVDGDALFAAEQRAYEAEEKAQMYDRAMTSMQAEMADLRGKLADAKAGGGKDESVNAEELKTLLSSIVYNVKIAHDDNDKAANKVAFDESTLEATLTKVFANILNPQTQQNDSEQTEKHWALESTLQTVKAVLDNIYTNTAKIGTVQIPNVDTITGTALDGRLTEIKAVLESINSKIAKGGVIATRGAVKQANAQPMESEAKVQAARSNMMKSLINDYKTMGKLAAQFANDGNLETQAMLENLKEEIARKRQSLRLTMDENKSLREKYSIAFDAEKRLLDAEKAQKEINAQNKADAKEAETAWKKQVKDAQRATGVNAATSAANSGDQTVLRAIGTEGISQDVENKAKELSEHIKTLRVLRDEIDKKGNQASDADRDKLSKQISKVKELKSEVDEYLKVHEKYSGDNSFTIGGSVDQFVGVDMATYEQRLTAAVNAATNGKAKIEGFNASTKELTYTVKTGANEFKTYTATVDMFDRRLAGLQTGTKRTEKLLDQIKRKTKEIFTYFSGSSLIFKAVNTLKKGIQYVRDIDLALTELKKVTDETEETYRKFLDTASKTAAKVGSTIKDVVSSTADWARLGYSMKEAAQFAETTQILMNVSEFTDVSQATDTLISSVQAFGYTAETSMDVVDMLNTIGNNYAISTADLAKSLTKSSASLVAAGGDLAEAAALTATANKIIQDADSVGK